MKKMETRSLENMPTYASIAFWIRELVSSKAVVYPLLGFNGGGHHVCRMLTLWAINKKQLLDEFLKNDQSYKYAVCVLSDTVKSCAIHGYDIVFDELALNDANIFGDDRYRLAVAKALATKYSRVAWESKALQMFRKSATELRRSSRDWSQMAACIVHDLSQAAILYSGDHASLFADLNQQGMDMRKFCVHAVNRTPKQNWATDTFAEKYNELLVKVAEAYLDA